MNNSLLQTAATRAADLLATIIGASDIIWIDPSPSPYAADRASVFLLVGLNDYVFQQLCHYGTEEEDLEDGHDYEADKSDYEPDEGGAPVSGICLAGEDREIADSYAVTPSFSRSKTG